jgi:hypothetical protein
MAARRKRIGPLDSHWRDKIKAGVLLDRLKRNGLGELDTQMSMGQIRSLEIVLKKTIPDLATVAHTGPDGGTPEVIHTVRPTFSREEWLKLFGK